VAGDIPFYNQWRAEPNRYLILDSQEESRFERPTNIGLQSAIVTFAPQLVFPDSSVFEASNFTSSNTQPRRQIDPYCSSNELDVTTGCITVNNIIADFGTIDRYTTPEAEF
jgi:hypothetical protein